MAPVLARNINALRERRAREEKRAGLQDRIADAVTRFAGSMTFVFLHLAVFGIWTLINSGLMPVLPKWDPTFVILGTAASVEAIFLSTFVLISQNRMAAAQDKRAELDLQVSLLSEHEVTRVLTLVAAIAAKLEIATEADPELDELEKDVAPEAVLNAIERQM